MLLREEGGRDASIGLRHAVFVYHATHMASVAWHLLSAHVVRGARHPIDRIFRVVAEDVPVDLGVRWKINCAHHALLESDAAHGLLLSASDTDLTIDRASSLAEEVILQRDVTSVTWEVLAGPNARILRAMLR